MSRINDYRAAPEPINKLASVTKYLESSSLDLTIAISLINAWNKISIGSENCLVSAIMRLVAVIFFVCSLFPGLATAQGVAPAPLLPDSFRWLSPPDHAALQSAWILGNEQKPGPYILRVKLAAEGRIPPHTHPDERNSTVLSGTIYVGFGEAFDESKVVALPAGAVYVTPANVPHYVWAKDGDAIYQESGVGPTGTSFIKR